MMTEVKSAGNVSLVRCKLLEKMMEQRDSVAYLLGHN